MNNKMVNSFVIVPRPKRTPNTLPYTLPGLQMTQLGTNNTNSEKPNSK